MEKARIVIDFMYAGAFLANFTDELSIECQFNPKEITYYRDTKWSGNEVPERDFPRQEFAGGSTTYYSMDLYFDAFAHEYYETDEDKKKRRDIRKDINHLMAATMRSYGFGIPLPYPYLGEPPTVILVWGGLKMFRGYLKTVTAKYTMFDDNGVPTRATASLTIHAKSHPLDFLPAQNPTSRTETRNTVRVTQGDRLDLIASNFYGDSRMWRAIAEANNLDDPFNLRPGQLLTMPNVD